MLRVSTTKAVLSIVSLILVSTLGCEDVVRVDLKTEEPRLVIECLAENGVYPEYMYISRSTDFYSPVAPTDVSGATAILRGPYYNDTLIGASPLRLSVYGLAGDTLWAKVIVGDTEYDAFTTVAPILEIDSLSFEYQEGGGLGLEEDEGYRLHVYFNDIPERHDFALLEVYRNGYQNGDFYLYDGRFSDGNAIDYSYFFFTFQPGDVASVNLRAIDEQTHEYLTTLAEVVAFEEAGNVFDITPANPNTNWSNGALGFFGVYNSFRMNVTVPE